MSELARRVAARYVEVNGDHLMTPADLLDLAGRAGGIDRLPAWFRSWWADQGKAAEEWRSYLSGQYICLRSVRPDTVTLIGSMA